jgi:methyl-accepting chemotaxis protein
VNRVVAEMNQVTQQNAASAEELSATMSMFKVGDNGRHNVGDALSQRKPLKKLTLSRDSQSGSEGIIPLKDDDFV